MLVLLEFINLMLGEIPFYIRGLGIVIASIQICFIIIIIVVIAITLIRFTPLDFLLLIGILVVIRWVILLFTLLFMVLVTIGIVDLGEAFGSRIRRGFRDGFRERGFGEIALLTFVRACAFEGASHARRGCVQQFDFDRVVGDLLLRALA